jgi:nitroreductase
MTIAANEVEQIKHAPEVPRVLPVILHRWSPRSFSERDVSPEDLRTLFEAARWAASSNNEQPWRYLVGTRGSETHQKIFESFGEWNRAWAGKASVLLLGTAKRTFTKNGAPNEYAMHDLGAADATICYQATALGLHTHQMAGFEHDVARRLFNIPEDYLLGSVMAIGYLGEPSALTMDYQREQEMIPRSRKPLNEMVFSEWDQPANLG